MSGHTPGPWLATTPTRHPQYNSIDVSAQIESDTKMIGEVYFPEDGHNQWQECVANTRLIEAAPDLLAACKLVVGDYDASDPLDFPSREISPATYQAVEAAIKKAEGE